ncbi:hypothetical protein C1C98_25855 [Pseudomonas ogarae]|uniref:DUF1534 domain-containing protein n=1 Tax=Pseudomonas ogarae (strain DSM 112162 / CECT 30235 / F113) TaxID=1114970 RepID=A0ABN5GDS5_PSEO1|nr:hypothetical protein C1C98_25855 [Pseudomonas ogarae]
MVSSRAGSLPQGVCCGHDSCEHRKKTVGASLLAMAAAGPSRVQLTRINLHLTFLRSISLSMSTPAARSLSWSACRLRASDRARVSPRCASIHADKGKRNE